MSHTGDGQPDRPRIVVDAVPKPAAAGDLVLPLCQLDAVHQPSAQRPLERVLSRVATARVIGDPLPSRSGVAGGGRTDLLPAPSTVVGRLAEVPARRIGWWRHPLTALGRHRPSARRGGHGVATRLQRTPKVRGSIGVGVNLRRCHPLTEKLTDCGEVVDHRCRLQRSG